MDTKEFIASCESMMITALEMNFTPEEILFNENYTSDRKSLEIVNEYLSRNDFRDSGRGGMSRQDEMLIDSALSVARKNDNLFKRPPSPKDAEYETYKKNVSLIKNAMAVVRRFNNVRQDLPATIVNKMKQLTVFFNDMMHNAVFA